MLYSSWPPMGPTKDPIIRSLYTVTWQDGEIPIPPSSNFIITEDGNFIVTETGERMITE